MSNNIKKMSLKDIFSTEALRYFVDPVNCMFFIKKRTAYEKVANLVNSSRVDAMIEMANAQTGDEIVKGAKAYEMSDNIVTSRMAEKMKEEYLLLSDEISTEKYLLFLAAITKDFLQDLDRAKKAVPGNLKTSELCYENGDIISISGNNIYLSRDGNRGPMSEDELQEFEDKMVEAILIANSQLNLSNKKQNLSIFGHYTTTGQNAKIIRLSLSSKELQEYAQDPRLIKRISISKMGELLDKDLISKNTLLNNMSKGVIDKNFAIQLMLEGKLTQEEVLDRVFKVKKVDDLLLNKDVSYMSKLLLYSVGKTNIDLLEKSVSQYQEETIDLTEDLRRISKYYSGDITKISELLTHNVLDYANSQTFLNILQEEGKITAEDRSYLDKVMVDFKTNELLNNSENEVISITNEGGNGPHTYRPGLTIDPKKRIDYLKSLGAVKKVKIRGENFIKDSENNVGKKNSLDGYELFIIPEKRIAILEKLYETARNENGEVEYRKSKDGKLIPALHNATYIIPIEMAVDFSRKKNKKELIEHPEVRRVNHSMEWVCNLESKISDLMQTRGMEVEFDKKNTELWAEKIRQNYVENKKRRDTEVIY